jgi:glutathione S-transferase
MQKTFTLYAWHLSYFSAKLRSYLDYKGIAYREKQIDLYTLTRRIKRHTGVVVMPVLRNPQGEWLQDTSDIIDRLESEFPELPVLPETPVQRFAAYLLEAWGDEWWVPIAMHTRWSHAENYQLWDREAGPSLLPWFPRFIQRMAAAYPARTLRNMLPGVGVRPEQFATLDAWTLNMLDLLDSHFFLQPYLLGGHPTLADFSLAGSLCAHLGRDPWPKRELIAPRSHLRAWVERMQHLPAQAQAPLLAGDGIAPTLEPVLRVICAEFVPKLEGILQRVNQRLLDWPQGKPLPRALDDIEIPTAQGILRRAALPYSLWMAQRVLDQYRQMTAGEQQKVRAWLHELGGQRLLELQIPRLRRVGLRVAVDQ